MVPTFVIGLREGLEAALIVGIIAAFLRKQGRLDMVRWVFVGVAAAILLCFGAGAALEIWSRNLPQRQQEGLETVIGALAVGMVTFMVVWMKRNSRGMKGQLEGLASEAMQGRSRAWMAMVAMAFLAVLREGLESVVFLLAAFNESQSGPAAAIGAVLGIAVAVALGYGIYRGGVRINLSKFFRATGVVLVLVAAGLVVSALRTAHEAGWLNIGQATPLDLTWLVTPGSVQSALLTGMLGIQGHPAVIEIIGWFAYLVPVGLYVAWPPGRPAPRALPGVLTGIGAAAAVTTVVVTLIAPASHAARPVTSAGGVSAVVVEHHGDSAVVRTQQQQPSEQQVGPVRSFTVKRSAAQQHAGLPTDVYTTTVDAEPPSGLPATLSVDRIAGLNGGRLPIGLQPPADSTVPAQYQTQNRLTVWVEPHTGRVVDLAWTEDVQVAITGDNGRTFPLQQPITHAVAGLPDAGVQAAVAAVSADHADLRQRRDLTAAAWCCGVVAVLALVGGLGMTLGRRRRKRQENLHAAAEPHLATR